MERGLTSAMAWLQKLWLRMVPLTEHTEMMTWSVMSGMVSVIVLPGLVSVQVWLEIRSRAALLGMVSGADWLVLIYVLVLSGKVSFVVWHRMMSAPMYPRISGAYWLGMEPVLGLPGMTCLPVWLEGFELPWTVMLSVRA